MKLAVLCGVSDGGKPHRSEVGSIEREELPGPRLSWDERFYNCPKHGALQIHDEDLLRRALNPDRPSILARSVRRMGEP